MKLCDWCEAPIAESAELCPPCLKAKADVDAGNLIPAKASKKAEPTILRQIGNGILLTCKGIALIILSALVAITGLLGTCAAVGAFGTLAAFALPWPIVYLLLSAFWFGIAYWLLRLTQRMLKAPLVSIDRPVNSARIGAVNPHPADSSSADATPQSEDHGDQASE